MPEIAEVYTIATQLNELLKGHTLVSMKKSEVSNLNLPNFLPIKLKKVEQIGKKIVFFFDGGKYMVVSLLMTGIFTLVADDVHNHLEFKFDNVTVYFHDVRRFGLVDYFESDDDYKKYISKIGPDFRRGLSLETWIDIFSKNGKKELAQFLLEQKSISGIGNYLRSEIMYQAGVLPNRILNTLTEEEVRNLYFACDEIIKRAIKDKGYSLMDYSDIYGKRGEFSCKVYKKKKDPNGNDVLNGSFKDKRTCFYVIEKQS